MSALERRPAAIGIAALSALLTAVAARRPWVRGTVDDAMVGGSLQEATGEEAVTGFVALGLVILAGAARARRGDRPEDAAGVEDDPQDESGHAE